MAKERILAKNTDVSAYVVDGIAYLSELTNDINLYYYWQPTFGDKAALAILN